MKLKKITFSNNSGEKISALLDFSSQDDPNAYAIFAHCFTCTKNTKAIANISKALAKKGMAVLRFDFTGLGESEGDFSDTNFSSNVADIVAAAQFLEQHYQSPQIVIGHSFGGTACLQAAVDIPSVRAVATIAAPAEPAHIERYLGQAREQIQATGQAEIELAGKPIKIKKQFLDDIGAAKIQEILPKLNRALLFLHSPADRIVDIEDADYLYATARHPKSQISLDSADHMLSHSKDSTYCGRMIAEWAGRYIDSEDTA